MGELQAPDHFVVEANKPMDHVRDAGKVISKDGKLTIEIERESDGRWLAEIPSVPGAMAYGFTELEAFTNALGIAKGPYEVPVCSHCKKPSPHGDICESCKVLFCPNCGSRDKSIRLTVPKVPGYGAPCQYAWHRAEEGKKEKEDASVSRQQSVAERNSEGVERNSGGVAPKERAGEDEESRGRVGVAGASEESRGVSQPPKDQVLLELLMDWNNGDIDAYVLLEEAYEAGAGRASEALREAIEGRIRTGGE